MLLWLTRVIDLKLKYFLKTGFNWEIVEIAMYQLVTFYIFSRAVLLAKMHYFNFLCLFIYRF